MWGTSWSPFFPFQPQSGTICSSSIYVSKRVVWNLFTFVKTFVKNKPLEKKQHKKSKIRRYNEHYLQFSEHKLTLDGFGMTLNQLIYQSLYFLKSLFIIIFSNCYFSNYYQIDSEIWKDFWSSLMSNCSILMQVSGVKAGCRDDVKSISG